MNGLPVYKNKGEENACNFNYSTNTYNEIGKDTKDSYVVPEPNFSQLFKPKYH